jgi:hypothetical protein
MNAKLVAWSILLVLAVGGGFALSQLELTDPMPTQAGKVIAIPSENGPTLLQDEPDEAINRRSAPAAGKAVNFVPDDI